MQDLFIDKPGYIEVNTTVPDYETAKEIANHLVKEKLAACVQIIDNVKSIYRWEGKIETASELVLVIKTKMNVYGKLVSELKKMHPYDLPEIIVKRIIEGSTQYLNWVEDNTID